ncbi:MAG: hypothetical protein V4601_07525 [Pseudomonadota bacterium]
MNTRMIAMTGAAFAMLASSAWAGESTPAEKEATRQLNLVAAQDAKPSAPQQVAVNASASTAPAQVVTSGTLSTITNPPAKIATANVLDANGKTVGAVRKVEVSPEGKPTRVSVAMAGAKEQIVVLDAGSVNYDAHKNEITALSGLPSNG